MDLHELKKASGSTSDRKRVGRGSGSNQGGQMPLIRRIPKRGFVNINKIYYQLVKVADLAKKFTEPGEVNPETMRAAGLIKNTAKPVKILGGGSLEVGLTVYAQACSKSAEEIISKAGGKVERI